MDLSKVNIGQNAPYDVNVVIEVPLGGVPVKYELEKESGALVPGVSAGGGAALGAATGGVVGLGAGAYTGVEQKREIYRNCMKNRGYSVLN